MKIAFAKQRYMPELTWSTHKWDGSIDALIDNYLLRSKWFSFIAEVGADVFVVDDGEYETHVKRDYLKYHPRGIKALYDAQPAINVRDIRWGDYDAVISIDPIIDRDIIDKHPKILWCYYAGEHKVAGFSASCKKPRRGYDVFLDHTLHVSGRKRSLPMSIPFPPLHSRKWAEAAFDVNRKNNAVFLDSRQIRHVRDIKAFKNRMEHWLGVPVAHPRPWDFANSYEEAARRRIMSTREFMGRLASCRYFLVNRGAGAIGQSIPEAASVGCIVLASSEIYSGKLCHPETRVSPQDYASAARTLSKLEADEGLRAEVLQHQHAKLAENFYRKPMAKLERLLEMKRG
jgi:hypothetical protein